MRDVRNADIFWAADIVTGSSLSGSLFPAFKNTNLPTIKANKMIVDWNKHSETRDDRLLMLKAAPENGEVSAQAVCSGLCWRCRMPCADNQHVFFTTAQLKNTKPNKPLAKLQTGHVAVVL